MKHLQMMCCVVVLAGAAGARADNVQTIAPYTGADYTDPIPAQSPIVVGTFDVLANDSSMTISGTFGNSVYASSSGVDLYLGNVLVASCVEFDPCYQNPIILPWSDTLTAAQIASLGTGVVDFTALQTSQFYIQLGTTTLDQVPGTPAVPEPPSLWLLGTGLLGFAAAVGRRLRV